MLHPSLSRQINHLISGLTLMLALFSLTATGQELNMASADSPSAPLKVKLAAEDNWAPFADPYGKGLSHRLVKQA